VPWSASSGAETAGCSPCRTRTWHEHHNPGTEPMIWFDGLDLPLVRNLDAVFFEPGGEEPAGYEPTRASRSERLYSGAGLLPAAEQAAVRDPESGLSSRLLAYRWPAVDAALSRLIETTGRSAARVRYADPATGRDIMPTVRAEMHRVLAGHRTPVVRTAGSGIWVVYRGAGATVIDGHRFDWTAGDMFVTPSWAAVDHEAADDADLFLFSDAPALEALGLARTEETPRQDVREEDACGS
jgi:gentisate 1,2-dioxygenase